MEQRLSPGLHLGVPHSVYHADPHERPSLSSHMAGILLSLSPAHAMQAHPRLGGVVHDSTSTQIENSIMHDLLLGGGADIVEVDAPDFKTKVAREARDAAIAAGKNPIVKSKLEQLRTQANYIRAAVPFLSSFALTTEATAIWNSDNGCPCRCRIDALDGFTIFDVKIFPDGTPSTVDRAAAQNGYFVQAAANIEAVEEAAEGAAGRTKFVLVFIDPNKPDIGTLFREVRGQSLEYGRRRWNRAKAIWAHCLESGIWPGFPQTIEECQCPAWLMNEEMDAAIAADVKPF